jgi:hypothetical protein
MLLLREADDEAFLVLDDRDLRAGLGARDRELRGLR